MLLFVGLGNPGPKHASNRHNIGFMAVQAIARRHELSPWRRRFQGVAVEGNIAKERILLLLPGTYMNESGRAVGEAANFYKLDTGSIVVFHDEVDLAPAKVRVKVGGGVAGHNGLRSITAHIGNEYKRVRIGIGKPDVKELVPMHVLGDFAKSEWAWVEALCDVMAEDAPLLVEDRDSSFQNKVHLAMEAKGFTDETDDDLPASK
ncbi:MAG TPA: aminoacyl-tRNA hydrolase [Bradyrhizobium sp.]|jgi:PTH1 family peptidyl-tRNA hydrolase|nr:aminoacyl-tRNA hydrolase [Bradyrhizobium sp.]